MTHGSLFSGIGGFDLAAEWMGWTNVFHCEINPFGQRVLKHYWPQAISYDDIKQTDFTIHRGQIDVISGGFPCQPFSTAGKRKGTEDDRHLWPEMLRAIREIQPRYVVGENVRGFTNWNGGVVFDQALSDLETEGYEVTPFLLPACAVNAPHRRDRIWIVAHAQETRGQRLSVRTKEEHAINRINGLDGPTPDSGSIESQRGMHTNGRGETERHASTRDAQFIQRGTWQDFPTQPPIRTRDDGFSRELVRFVESEFYGTISETDRIQNVQEVWERVSQEEVWDQVRRLYSLERKDVLLQTMQLYQAGAERQVVLSPFSETFSGPIMQKLRKYGKFAGTPQGQELEKQRQKQFGNSLWFLPHEVALASRAFETQLRKFETWHRKESIMAYGNAIVPQVAFEIFKVIEKMK